MNKKGMELSITFLVGLILGIVLLSLGLVFFYKILSGVGEIQKTGLPNYFDVEAKNCVQRGDRVCIPNIKQKAELLETTSFGVILNNIYGETKNFKIIVKFSRGITDEGQTVNSITLKEWTFADFEKIELENNENIIIEIPIRPPKSAKAGNYVFNVNVCFNAAADVQTSKCPTNHKSLYSPTQQITVEVI